MPDKQPTMMTIREVARTGILSEHALRLMDRDGKLPVLYIGRKALINYDSLCEVLQGLKLGTQAFGSGLPLHQQGERRCLIS